MHIENAPGIGLEASNRRGCVGGQFTVAGIAPGKWGAKVGEARKKVPSLTHDRPYAPPELHKAPVPKAAE